MDTIIITGGLGFVGFNLAKYLLKNDYNVVIVDVADFFSRSKFLEQTDRLKIIYQNLAADRAYEKLPEKIKYVIHLAALPHVDYSSYHENETILNNILSLKNILLYSIENGSKVVFSSSVEVYGGCNKNNIYSETDALRPQSIYGVSKQFCEQLVAYYQDKFNIDCVTLRFTNLYGVGQLPDRIIPRNICRLAEGIRGDLTANFYRDFLYVEDAIKAVFYMLMKGKPGTYNLSSGKSYNMKFVIDEIVKSFNTNDISNFDSIAISENRGKYLNIDNSKILTYVQLPMTSIEDGIKFTVEWYLKNRDWYIQFRPQYEKERNDERFIIDANYLHLYFKEKESI